MFKKIAKVVGMFLFLSSLVCSVYGYSQDKKPIFYCSFDDTTNALVSGEILKGEAEGISFVPGYKGKAMRVVSPGYCWYETLQNLPTKAGTVEMWIKPEKGFSSLEAHWKIFLYTPGFRFCVAGNYGPLMIYPGAKPYPIRYHAGLLEEQWFHLATTWKDGEATFYYNGQVVGKGKWNENFTWGKKLCVGGIEKNWQAHSAIDELKIYDYPLPEEHFAKIYSSIYVHGVKKEENNLIINSGFQAGLANWYMAGRHGKFDVKIDLQVKHNGKSSFKVTKIEGDKKAYFRLRQLVSGLQSGKSYTLSAWIKNPNKDIKALLICTGGKGGPLLWRQKNFSLPMSDNWQKIEWRFKVVPQQDLIEVQVGENLGEEPIWISDIWLLEEASVEALLIQKGEKALSIVSSQGHAPPEDAKLKEWFDWDINNAWSQESQTRKKICLNGLWRFRYVKDVAEVPGGEWGYWKVPGCFGNEGFFQGHGAKGAKWWEYAGRYPNAFGDAWFEREFKIPQLNNRRVILEFNDLRDRGHVFLNGKYLITADAFEMRKKVDVTGKLIPGWNRLNVFLETIKRSKNEPRGIDGDVFLHLVPAEVSFVQDQTQIITQVRGGNKLIVKVIINNHTNKSQEVNLTFLVKNKKKEVFKKSKPVLIPAGESLQIMEFPWEKPVYWSPENPHLYFLQCQLYSNKKLLDETIEEQFGFREFYIENAHFHLNDHPFSLRLYTSPPLSFGYNVNNEKFIRDYFGMLKKVGFNSVRLMRRFRIGSYDSDLEKVYKIADEEGVMVLTSAPGAIFGGLGIAGGEEAESATKKALASLEEKVGNYVKAYRNHPSIVMWHQNFNWTQYLWALNPHKMDWEPPWPWWQNKKRVCERCAEVLHKYDPTRPVFFNAGGNCGPVFTTVLFMGFDVPLQEREDWPIHWAKKPKKPLINIEVDFPYYLYYYQIARRDKILWGVETVVKEDMFFAENLCRYFGDDAYDSIKKPTLELKKEHGPWVAPWVNPTDKDWKMNDLNLKLHSLFAKRTLRSWRTYGAILGTFSEFPMFFEPTGINNYIDPIYPFKYTSKELNSPGMHPYRIYSLRGGLRDPNRITSLGKVFAANNQPILIYIGGEKGRFTSKDHSYFSGQRIDKQAIIINDTRRDLKIKLYWSLIDAQGNIVSKQERNAEVNIGCIAKLPVKFTAPFTKERKDFILKLEAKENKGLIASDSFSLQVFPPQKPLKLREAIALYDEKGITTSLLKETEVSFEPLEELESLAGTRIIIVGRESLTSKCRQILNRLQARKWINAGGNIIIFEQSDLSSLGLKMKEVRVRDAYIRMKDHPILSGLKAVDFHNWKGNSSLMPDYPEFNPTEAAAQKKIIDSDINESNIFWKNQRHIFDSWIKDGFWKNGNTGVIATFPIEEPYYGNYHSLVETGFDMKDSLLLELYCQKGHIILCQLDVSNRYCIDPVSTTLVNNLLRYASSTKALKWQETLWLSTKKNSLYDSFCIDGEKINELKQVGRGVKNLVIEDNYKLTSQEKAVIDKFVNKGGRVIWLVNKESNPNTLSIKTKQVSLFKATPIDNKLLKGLGVGDFYWRDKRSIITFNSEKGETLTQPSVLYKKQQGKGEIVFCSIIPEEFKPKDFDSYGETRMYIKSMQILSTLFTNCGMYCNLPYGKRLIHHQEEKESLSTISLEKKWKFSIDPEDIGLKGGYQKEFLDDKHWKLLDVPGGWEKQGIKNKNPYRKYKPGEYAPDHGKYAPYDGYAWYRTTVVIPEIWKGKKMFFIANGIDDYDWTYFNGQEIGHTGKETPVFWMAHREYIIPQGLIHFGKENTLAIRLFDIHGEGGFKKNPVEISLFPKVVFPYVKITEYNPDMYHSW